MSITKSILIILSLFFLNFFSVYDSSINSKEKNEIIELFNGIDLSGWIIHGTEKWYVEDGELVCENGQDKQYGYLSTVEYYDDFILTLEFKQESNGNSGVFFRSTLEGVIISGWQVEIAPPGLATGGIYESYGREWLVKPNPKDENLIIGDWNSMKIMVNGDIVKTWLNGIKMISLEDRLIGKGKGSIVLQIHEGDNVKVRWRNIKLEKL
ncbi:MAG: secreted glycosyl hydrolase [Rickettsiales bacterium]|nr:secreted glycosyl hydrolase [Rickettsiales bacterium]|tara:strand:+ start:1215 stop:1844 length:630 start_codon:yes stop_codon:yes gene_type:complete